MRLLIHWNTCSCNKIARVFDWNNLIFTFGWGGNFHKKICNRISNHCLSQHTPKCIIKDIIKFKQAPAQPKLQAFNTCRNQNSSNQRQPNTSFPSTRKRQQCTNRNKQRNIQQNLPKQAMCISLFKGMIHYLPRPEPFILRLPCPWLPHKHSRTKYKHQICHKQ